MGYRQQQEETVARDHHQRSDQRSPDGLTKKVFESPRLREYGSAAKLTRGGSGSLSDGVAGTMRMSGMP